MHPFRQFTHDGVPDHIVKRIAWAGLTVLGRPLCRKVSLLLRYNEAISPRTGKPGGGNIYSMNHSWREGVGTPTSFRITIGSTRAWDRQRYTCIHEMVHLRQMATGKLVYVSFGTPANFNDVRIIWDGVDIGLQPDFPYDKRPWEHEAYEYTRAFEAMERMEPEFTKPLTF